MSRYRFGLWGIGLDDNAFDVALAGAGVQGVAANGIIEFRAPTLPPAMSAADASSLWQSIATSVQQIEVTSAGDLDPMWLAAELARAVPNGGVHFRRDDPEVAVAWQWPLRIGLFADDRSSELRTALDQSSMKRLVQFVDVGREAAECELLLIPCNLRASVERALSATAPITADCTIVLGGAKVDGDRIESLMAVLRGEIHTSGVALASVPKGERGEWFRALIAHLSHSNTIDVALCQAARNRDLAAPLLICSRKLAELATLRYFVERMGGAMKRARKHESTIRVSSHASRQLGLPETASLDSIGDRLESNAAHFDYEFESGDATAIVETRAAVEKMTAETLDVPRMTAHPPAAREDDSEFESMAFESISQPTESKVSAERFLRAGFFSESKAISQSMIVPRSAYFLRIHIGPPDGKGPIANVPLDESQLPASPTGHELTIALFELREDDHAPVSPPARATVFLPPDRSRASTYAWFPILAPPTGAFSARILVLHQTRVLQTLLFRAPVSEPESFFTIEQENIIQPTFDILGTRRAFDAALVVNKAGGKTAVMGVTGKSVAYNEPVGIAASIDAISKTISELTKLPDKVKLEDAAVVKVLIQLARHGKLLADWIATKLPPELAGAKRIQLVEARLGAFLPLEFVYPSFAPDKKAKLCPHGKKELAAPHKTKCPNERDRNFVCPSVFWGFNRVIERWPHMDLKNNFDYQLSVPKGNGTKLDPLESALMGASKRVNAADVASTKKALKPLLKSEVHVVTSWDDWPAAVEDHSPSLLILFPHSDEDEGIAALEIGKDFLQVSSLESDYVRPEDHEPGPVVLLLGCSTKLPRVAFHDFVSRFRMKGAAVVVGTLSLIRGRHATRFVGELLAVMKQCAGTKNAVFGDVMLQTKQTMLAAGDPFALTLIAYGDADWRL